jgi:hypothetical protein
MSLEKNHCTEPVRMCVFNSLYSTLDVTCRQGTPRQGWSSLPTGPGSDRGQIRTQNYALRLAQGLRAALAPVSGLFKLLVIIRAPSSSSAGEPEWGRFWGMPDQVPTWATGNALPNVYCPNLESQYLPLRCHAAHRPGPASAFAAVANFHSAGSSSV